MKFARNLPTAALQLLSASVAVKRIKKLAESQLHHTARHEAAHATVAAMLAVPIRHVDIRPDISLAANGLLELTYGITRYDIENADVASSPPALLSALATVAAAGLIAEARVPAAEAGIQDDINSLHTYARLLQVHDFTEFLNLHHAKATVLLNTDQGRMWHHLTQALKVARHMSGARVTQVIARAQGTLGR